MMTVVNKVSLAVTFTSIAIRQLISWLFSLHRYSSVRRLGYPLFDDLPPPHDPVRRLLWKRLHRQEARLHYV
jgi:hypothetical protein